MFLCALLSFFSSAHRCLCVCFHLWHNQLKGSHALRCSVPADLLEQKSEVQTQRVKWKAYKHSCFATSLKCAGNPQEIMVCSRWGAVFCWRDFAGCAADAECCRAFQKGNDTMSVHFTFFIFFYNNTICAMVCLCVSLSWVHSTYIRGTLESCIEVPCSGEVFCYSAGRRGVLQTRSAERFKKQMMQQISNFVSQSHFL